MTKETTNKSEEIIGKKFGTLTVIEDVGLIGKNRHYLCMCDCGTEKIISKYSLTLGLTMSCGCKTGDLISKKVKKHGMQNTRFYTIWVSMKQRAKKKIGCYSNVSICDKWNDFLNFKNDMYDSYLKHCEKFGEKQTTIDRIDFNKSYFVGNCRWATYQEQAENRSITKIFKAISPEGIECRSNNSCEFARKHNLDRTNISACLQGRYKQHKGWRFEYV